MLWEYIGKVLSFAFRRTTPTIDSLQIVAASAVPAAADVLGVKMAANVTNDVLAYIGAIAVVFIFLRLVSAPYFIWREQVGEIGALKIELSRPERLEFERMAKHRAKVRAKMAGVLRRMHWVAFDKDDLYQDRLAAYFERLTNLSGGAGLGQAFADALDLFHNSCVKAVSGTTEEQKSASYTRSFILVENMLDYLHGRLTGEALALRLPKDTEEEKQQ